MAFSGKPILFDWRNQIPYWKEQIGNWLRSNQWKLIALGICSMIVWQKDLNFKVEMQRHATVRPEQASGPDQPGLEATSLIWTDENEGSPVSNPSARTTPVVQAERAAPVTDRSPAEQERYQERMRYVQRFAKVAQGEMRKYGIPASITLAQGLLESSAGNSRLSRENNNHFGIKCHSRTCRKGHCSNFSDDSHKDFFRIFENAWSSYRAHSLVLQRERYQFLYDFDPTDYRSWAFGLRRAGYATDPQYGEKLIRIIESLELYRYDSI